MVDQKHIQRLIRGHSDFISRANEAELYYKNDNDIKRKGASPYLDLDIAEKNPLKIADNRVSHNWHQLLVDQKAGYVLTYPPLFDVGSVKENEQIAEVLGDEFRSVSKNLCIAASNCGVAWLHYWMEDGAFQYACVDPRQVIPVFSHDLQEKLIGVLRAYVYVDNEGKEKRRCEYWDDRTVRFFEEDSDGAYVPFFFPEVGEEMVHGCGEVPFIMFRNNAHCTSDLRMYKDLIDIYDKVYSGFANDIEDVQELIFVIKNYGGTDKEEFIKELKLKKVIKVDEDGGVDTIRAEIPHEARNEMLELTRKKIFSCGMGVDPEADSFGNASGVALEYLYSLLELKAGAIETEFRTGFSKLIRAICRLCRMTEPKKLIQTWTRNRIRNDSETAQIAIQSKDLISDKSILKNHPWVEDVEAEEKQLAKETEEKAERQQKVFGMVGNTPPVMNDEE